MGVRVLQWPGPDRAWRDMVLAEASRVLLDGGLVVLPTDTVYGLAALHGRDDAIQRIYSIKGRPSDKPLPLLVSAVEQVVSVGAQVPEEARMLAARFWPGPVTLVLPGSADKEKLGFRMPAHSFPIELMQRVGAPLASTSANRSGEPSPEAVSAVLTSLGEQVDLVIDAGRCLLGVDSTVVDVSGGALQILRQGALPSRVIMQTIHSRAERGEPGGREPMLLAVGCDHAGLELMNLIRRWLENREVPFIDMGTNEPEAVDYPDIALRVARAVALGNCDMGILVCGTGIGQAIAANKVPGVRAATCHDAYTARLAREHNNANVLCLGQRVVGAGVALEAVSAWLSASFSSEERHRRRVDMLEDLDRWRLPVEP